MKILLQILNGIGEVIPIESNKWNPLCEMDFLFLSQGFSDTKFTNGQVPRTFNSCVAFFSCVAIWQISVPRYHTLRSSLPNDETKSLVGFPKLSMNQKSDQN